VILLSNRIKEIWQTGGVAINGWLHIPSTWSAEVLARQGWDSVTVDMQHGMMGIESTIQMLQAVSLADVVPMARVNWNEPGIIMRLLDAGAMGLICPMVNTHQECEAFVGACRYAPDGYRSLGPTRAKIAYGADYAQQANANVLTFAMVETQTALDNVDEIAGVPGLDAVFVGAGDLRLSILGEFGHDKSDDVMSRALDTILAACDRHNIAAGIWTASPAYAIQMIARGFRLVTVQSDTLLLAQASAAAVAAVHNSMT
jgi:4-hydroxy-2-oxoheptanedioate aldolase